MAPQHVMQVATDGQRGKDEIPSTMAGDGNWANYVPMGVASPDLLHGMTLFDSPMSEMIDMDLGDDIDLDIDALLQEEMEMGQLEYGQGQAPLPTQTNGWSANTDIANGQLTSGLNFVDPLLFPDFDPAFDLDTTGLDLSAPPFTSSVNASPYSSYATTNGSPFCITHSPVSSHGSEEAGNYPYQCTTDSCGKTFQKESQLKQHQRVHKKAFMCRLCYEQGVDRKYAQVRDLERHMHTRHKELAEKANVRSETRECPFPGCEHRGRRDNVSRHYESKHGGKLKWRKGVPSVV